MDLKDYRIRIDEIDNQLVQLFRQRMEIAGEIAAMYPPHGPGLQDGHH